MNVIARLEFELAYHDYAIHRFSHYTTNIVPWGVSLKVNVKIELAFYDVEVQHISHYTPFLQDVYTRRDEKVSWQLSLYLMK